MSKGKIVDAYAEWDDRAERFRVYLVREVERTDDEQTFTDRDDGEPMASVLIGGEIECRLYRAIICAHPKDFGGAHERLVGFAGKSGRAKAERAAKAVKAELLKIERGEPGPSDMACQIAGILMPRKRARS